MKLLVIPNFSKAKTCQALRDLLALSSSRGIEILGRMEDQAALTAHGFSDIQLLDHTVQPSDCDMICVIGGDGTLLRYAGIAASTGIPITGINTGNLGFLTQIDPDYMDICLDAIVEGRYKIDNRLALSLSWSEGKCNYILNDVLFSGMTRTAMTYFSIYCDGQIIERYRADALILATPTGSTAYNLSAGGAVLEASLNTITLLPICAQLGLKLPLIFSADHTFTFTASNDMELICDGKVSGILRKSKEACITPSTMRTPTVSFPHIEVFPGFRKKLSLLSETGHRTLPD